MRAQPRHARRRLPTVALWAVVGLVVGAQSGTASLAALIADVVTECCDDDDGCPGETAQGGCRPGCDMCASGARAIEPRPVAQVVDLAPEAMDTEFHPCTGRALTGAALRVFRPPRRTA